MHRRPVFPLGWPAKAGWFSLGFLSFSLIQEYSRKADYRTAYTENMARLTTLTEQPRGNEKEMLQIYEWLMLPREVANGVKAQHLRPLDEQRLRSEALNGTLLIKVRNEDDDGIIY